MHAQNGIAPIYRGDDHQTFETASDVYSKTIALQTYDPNKVELIAARINFQLSLSPRMTPRLLLSLNV
jgi:hypothetical protein